MRDAHRLADLTPDRAVFGGFAGQHAQDEEWAAIVRG
jgi:hypothetical protein